MARPALKIPFEFPPFALSGRVYGALLNHRTAVEAIADAASKPPYNGLPKAPVLFIKPRNTLALSGESIEVPAGEDELEVAAMLGLVMMGVLQTILLSVMAVIISLVFIALGAKTKRLIAPSAHASV